MRWALLCMLVACGSVTPPTSGSSEPQPPVEVRVMLQGKPRAGGGSLTVQTEYDAMGQVEVPIPTANGLEFVADGSPTLEHLGDRQVVTQVWVYKGRSGHYEIAPVTVVWTPPDPEAEPVAAGSTPVFLDIEAEPIVAGEMGDIEDPAAIVRLPWAPILIVGGLLAGGLAVAFWPARARRDEVEVPDAPDVAALRAWDAVRRDARRTDDDKARELSVIFRVYAEAVLHFEATAWTTREILGHLRGMTLLPEGNVPRAKRLLRATDRIKFAEERSSAELIEELDADLRAFVAATRPVHWSAPTGER